MEFSQISSSLNLQSLHADSLIWTNKTIEMDQNMDTSKRFIYNSNKSDTSFIKTKTKPINKDEILSFIKPDYGSLGQFITDINLSTDFLKQKKKKSDGQDEAEEKRIRQHLQNRNLNKILCNNQSTFQQRSVACKLLIQRSFQEAFGSSINEFYQQQIQRLEPQQKKSTLNIGSLSDALDEIINQSQRQMEQKPNGGLMYVKQNSRKNRSYLRDNTYFLNQKQNVLKRLTNYKNNYRSLQKLNIPEEPTAQFNELLEKYSRQSKPLLHNRQSSYSSTSSNHDNSMFKSFEGKSFVINPTEVSFNNLYEVSNETVLYAFSKINFTTLEEFSIINTSFSNPDVLFLMLDLMVAQARNLKALVVQDITHMLNVKNREKLSQKVKNILQTASDSLQLLRLNQLGLQTKDFCILCLGIGSSKRLETVEMKNNTIDDNAKKSYDVITKFFRNLEINLEGNPIQADIAKCKLKSSKVIPK